jgi:hypothetical protein
LRPCWRRGHAQLRDALCKSRVAGSASLPELPGKALFATSAKELELRQRAFYAMLTHIGAHAELASADATCAFLSGACALARRHSRVLKKRTHPDAPKPDYGVVHRDALAAVRAVLAVKDWEVQYSKNGIEIAVHACTTSDLHMIRSSVLVPLSVERTHAHYKARAQATHASGAF